MNNKPCHMNDIINLNEQNIYCISAKCITLYINKKIRDKSIDKTAAWVWRSLYEEVYLTSKDWSMKASVRYIANMFCMSISTTIKCLRSLEREGFITILKGSNMSNEPNTIKIRFPEEGIEWSKTQHKRKKTDKKLSTDEYQSSNSAIQNLEHPCSKNQNKYYTNNNTNINNNRDSDINTAREELSESVSVNFVDDLDYIDEMMDGEKPSLPHHDHNHECLIEDFEHDDDECPFDEDIAMLEKQIIDMQNKEKIAKEQYKSDKRDTSSFQTWQNIEAFIETAKIELEAMQCKRDKFLTSKNANKSDLANVEESQPDKQNTHLKESDKNTKQNTDYCLPTPIKLSDKQIKMIASKVNILHKQGFVSDPAGLVKMIIYQVSRNRVGKTVEHGINICIKLVRENRYRTPAGYVDPGLCKRDFDVMRNNVIKHKVSSSFNNLF